MPSPSDVSVVICTMNSAASIGGALAALRAAGVGEIVVVDAHSTDGTRELAEELADIVVQDPGIGLGFARNAGIERTTKDFILNLGSDNIITREALQVMIDALVDGGLQGVSALTEVEGSDYVSQAMNEWRRARFRPGPAAVIGTPTLFLGDLLRANPYDATRQHSDDAELCERWARETGARFAISSAVVSEVGKSSWSEIAQRCRNYGFSDYEVFTSGRKQGWSTQRQVTSLAHPLRVDLIQPVQRLGLEKGLRYLPFFAGFTSMRYAAWIDTAVRRKPTAN